MVPVVGRAYVRGLYVTQDLGYTNLVTEGVPYGNLFMKILGMLLGAVEILTVSYRLRRAEYHIEGVVDLMADAAGQRPGSARRDPLARFRQAARRVGGFSQ